MMSPLLDEPLSAPTFHAGLGTASSASHLLLERVGLFFPSLPIPPPAEALCEQELLHGHFCRCTLGMPIPKCVNIIQVEGIFLWVLYKPFQGFKLAISTHEDTDPAADGWPLPLLYLY